MARRKTKNFDGQAPMFPPESDWRPPMLSDLPASWAGAKRVGIDVETYDPHLFETGPSVRTGGYMVGFSFAIEDGPAGYVPLRHRGGDNVADPQAALAWLRDRAREFTGLVCGANLSYDLDWLEEEGVTFPNAKGYRDTHIADPLICELHRSYSLQAISQRLGFPGKDQALLEVAANVYRLKNPRGDLWQLPARFVGPYGEEDARLPLAVLRKQERLIDEQDLWEVYDLECRVLPALVAMRRVGVLIDQDHLDRIEEYALAEEHKAIAEIKRLSGVEVPVGGCWRSKSVAAPLGAVGVAYRTDAKGEPSITKEFLESCAHPVAERITWLRKVNKLRSTFVKSIRRHMVNGRIHCSYNQLRKQKEDGSIKGAAYGRLSSENPNMQQQPARDDFTVPWRAIFKPEPGALWACLDYSQQEPRILTHYAELTGCTGARAAAQRYRDNPRTDNHQMMSDMTGLKRGDAKQIYLALCYGMGPAKMCHKLHLSTKWIANRRGQQIEVAGDDGAAMIDRFNAHAPFVKEMAEKCEATAKARGYLIALGGRRCRFPVLEDGSFDWTYKALNRLIQGGAAKQMKVALVTAHEAGYMLQLQVHDELDTSVDSLRQAEEIATIMRDSSPELNVPAVVDIEIGPNWADITKVQRFIGVSDARGWIASE